MGEPGPGQGRRGYREAGRAGGAEQLGIWGTNPPLGSAHASSVPAKWGAAPHLHPASKTKGEAGIRLGCGEVVVRGAEALAGVGRDTHKAGILEALGITSTAHVPPDVIGEGGLRVAVVTDGGVYDANLHRLEDVGRRQRCRGVEGTEEMGSGEDA